MSRERCRHNKNWLIAAPKQSAGLLWCYECGAIRNMRTDGYGYHPVNGWVKPVGKGGENPTDANTWEDVT